MVEGCPPTSSRPPPVVARQLRSRPPEVAHRARRSPSMSRRGPDGDRGQHSHTGRHPDHLESNLPRPTTGDTSIRLRLEDEMSDVKTSPVDFSLCRLFGSYRLLSMTPGRLRRFPDRWVSLASDTGTLLRCGCTAESVVRMSCSGLGRPPRGGHARFPYGNG
jgi:hypothetical protein